MDSDAQTTDSMDVDAPHGNIDERRRILLGMARAALEQDDLATLRLVLNGQHPADLAPVFDLLDDEQRLTCLGLLAEPLAADTLAEMDAAIRLDLTEDLDSETLSGLVEEMAPDDAADVLGDLTTEQSESVLGLMEDDDAADLRELLTHPDDTGGGIMTSRLLSVAAEATVTEAVESLRQWAEEEEVFYLYVVDTTGRLTGTVPLKELLLVPQDTRIAELMESDPISVPADTDQEQVARLFDEYDLLALPVVDGEGRPIGLVTVDDAVDVMRDEATEDIDKMAAILSGETDERSTVSVMRRRLPWLLVCLAGTLVSGVVIQQFSASTRLADIWVLLTIFMPAIMAMGGNSGIQTSTVTVRSLATGDLVAGQLLVALGRELRVALGVGAFLAALVLAVAYAWTSDPVVSGCVGLAMLSAVVLSAGLGALTPLLFRALGIDPAVASGPLITTLNDVVSLLIYFSIALVALSQWR